MNEKEFGDKIKKLRTGKKMTQQELAKELHVSDKTISKWETGNSIPDYDRLVDIVNYFSLDEDNTRDAILGKQKENRKIVKGVIIFLPVIVLLAICVFVYNCYRFDRIKKLYEPKVYQIVSDREDIIGLNGYYIDSPNKSIVFINRMYYYYDLDIITDYVAISFYDEEDKLIGNYKYEESKTTNLNSILADLHIELYKSLNSKENTDLQEFQTILFKIEYNKEEKEDYIVGHAKVS